MKNIFTVSILLFLSLGAIAKDSSSDDIKIKNTVLDYINGWYRGDQKLLGGSLHPDLVKRQILPGIGKIAQIVTNNSANLLAAAGAGQGKRADADRISKQIRVLAKYENMASASAETAEWVDYLQLVKSGDRWLILNVVWQTRKKEP